jgi:hypothetical protein
MGVLGCLLLAACVSTSGQPKAYEPAPLGRPLVMPAPIVSAASIRTVTLEQEVIEGFQFMYQYVDETEFVLCLEGRRSGNRIHVTGFKLARMKTTSAYRVAYEDCANNDYIGTAHNHPPTRTGATLCYQSEADHNSFHTDSRAVVDIILCGESRYLWVLKDGRSKIEAQSRPEMDMAAKNE